MDAEKAFKIQSQVRNDVKTLQSYITDLQSWENEMKRKEAALKGEIEQSLPPVRSKVKKDKPVVPVKKSPEKRIKASDYNSWDKFDADKACEDVDMQDVGPSSLDGKNSQQEKMEKLREEAQYEKERGNQFVKNFKWNEAIACYSRAIELVKDDPIYYANRGLCYLKKDNLHQAEKDCTEALKLDPTYVKALQRRATARERLNSLRPASEDLKKVLEFEPRNAAAKKQLDSIKAKIGSKGANGKTSPVTAPAQNNSAPTSSKPAPPKIVEISPKPTSSEVRVEKNVVVKEKTAIEKWCDGDGENITLIKNYKKPAHLRSKRSTIEVPIKEIPLRSKTVKPSLMKITEVDNLAKGDSKNSKNNENSDGPKTSHDGPKVSQGSGDVSNINDTKKSNENNHGPKTPHDGPKVSQGSGDTDTKSKADLTNGNGPIVSQKQIDTNKENNNEPKLSQDYNDKESLKMVNESIMEKDIKGKLVAPVNSVQFMAQWKYLKGNDDARSHYLSLIEPSKIPSIFANALESDILSDVITILHQYPEKFSEKTVTAYLKGLVGVKRFSALAMFLSFGDKSMVSTLLGHCKSNENCTENEIADLTSKFEIS